jgi:hypothetical protein
MFSVPATIPDRDRSRLRKKRGGRGAGEKSKYRRGSSCDGKSTNSENSNFTVMSIKYRIDH